MIDLSHLTEEEQGVIMTVLKRDVELKKAEEERIRKLEKMNSGTQSDIERKYLTGEWFYEAKSRRHMDKIHGSEIILASMKHRTGGLDGSVTIERSRTPSSRGSDIAAPPKPARYLEVQQLQPQEINDAEKENINSVVRSPRTPRHNPFNRGSLIVVEPPENNKDMSSSRDQQSSERETISPLRSHPAGEASQTSGSVTSDGSSVGFRPVPKRRTFLSRRTSSQSESNSPVLDAQAGSTGVVPSPRRSFLRGSSGSSNQSYPRGQEEMPRQSVVSSQVSAQPSNSLDENSQQPHCDVSQVSSKSSLERERTPSCVTTDRSADDSFNSKHLYKFSNPTAASLNLHNFRPDAYTRSDASIDRDIPQNSDRQDDQTEHAAVNTLILHTGSIQDSDRENTSSVGTAMRQEELSLTRSIVDPDPPVSYDLNFIDTSDQQMQIRSNQKHAFKLTTQTTSPTGDEEDSIAKVLDWFSRSTDSSDWLNTENNQEAHKGTDKHVEISKLRNDDLLRKGAGDIISDRKRETLEMKRSHLQRQTKELEQLKASERIDNTDLTKTQEPQISHLMSFWEKSNPGPRILVSKSITPGNKGQKPNHLSAEKDEEKVNKPYRVSDMPSMPGVNNGKGSYDKHASNQGNEREQQLVISPQKDIGENVHLDNNQEVDSQLMNTSTQWSNNEPTDYSKSAASPQVADRRGSDTEILGVSRLNPQPQTANQSRLSPESESVPLVQPNQQPDSVSQSRQTPLRDELSKTIPVSHLDTELLTRDSSDSEKLSLSRNSAYMDYKQGGNDVQITKAQMRKGSSEDVKSRDSEDKSTQSSMSPKRKEDTPNKDRLNSPLSNRQSLLLPESKESTAERIKQLKLFWEQERNKSMFYTGKPNAPGEGRAARGVNQAKLNKRFTKSEYDLSSIGNYSGSDEEDSSRNHQNCNALPLNQRIEKSSPSLGTSRTQFNSLREFWGEASSDTKGSFDKPKSPKNKDLISSQRTSQELKSGDPDVYRVSAALEKTRPAVLKSSPPLQSRSKTPHDRQTGSGLRAANDSKSNLCNYTTTEQQRESRRSSKDSNREEKSTKPPNSSGKETRSPKSRKDSFGNSSSRVNSMRRTISMFALIGPEEKDQSQLKMDVSPVHSQSRKQRQNAERGALPRRAAEETETLAPLARACVPRDVRHYLGMTDTTSIHTSLDQAPGSTDEGSEGKSGCDFDVGGLVRTSTPVSSEERYGRKGSKTSQRPLWENYSSSDTGQESSLSSTSDTWWTSRNSSNRDNYDVSQHPVRKALKRAEARPKNLAKSMEDITASVSPRQERRQDPTADMRHISDVSSIPSPSSPLFSDLEHLKKMSKSVPSFLQNEDVGRDTDYNKDSYRRRRLMGNSLTNLTSNSDMTSVSSLSGSVMTMDFGNVEVQGSIQYSINYVQRLKEFHIFVSECRDLAAVDPKRRRSDPYVKSYLVPDKANLGKRKTSVKKKTLNPTFNEILRYRVRMEYLRTQTLILSVWHHDTFGRNSFLGEVDMDLSRWDFDHTQMNNLALKARSTPTVAPSNGRGEMRLAIRFLPQISHSEGLAKDGPNTGELHIWVKECKNLPPVRFTIDPYVKCFVLPDTSRKSRQKTRVLRRTVDPAFNHTMVYDGIREADLAEACVELTVWDRDRLASNLLGGLRIGGGTGRSYGAAVDWMDSTPFEVALWERMKASPNEWVEDMLPLRGLSSAKTAFK